MKTSIMRFEFCNDNKNNDYYYKIFLGKLVDYVEPISDRFLEELNVFLTLVGNLFPENAVIEFCVDENSMEVNFSFNEIKADLNDDLLERLGIIPECTDKNITGKFTILPVEILV